MPYLQAMKRNIGLHVATLLALVVVCASFCHGQERSFGSLLSQVPDDSLEAERVRIWIPIEGGTSCRVTVRVLAKDNSGRIVATLLDRIVPPGYHNLYWNKKDSLEQFVDAGVYPYTIDGACGLKKRGKVYAGYKAWETFVSVGASADTAKGGFSIQLLKDSARVSIEVFSMGDMPLGTPIRDSIMMAGTHEFRYNKPPNYPTGTYWCWLTVGDFRQKVKFMVKE
jgi:hypothetical protein